MVDGNTETSTERRIIFNPEIPGPRVAGARDEWRVLIDIAKRVSPEFTDKIGFPSTEEIREEIARAIPYYDGIQNFKKKGDQIQYGGELLCKGGQFNTADGKAHFTPVIPPQRTIPEGWFQLTTRRGKQFNSMVFGNKDILSGSLRDEVIMSADDMERLSVRERDPVIVRSETGEFQGIVHEGRISNGTVMMFWPEANVLIRRGVLDSECGIPAYRDEVVQVLPMQPLQETTVSGQ
jgi:predicted molibdopterin-dependent oxidoreductase YjgC